MPSGFVYDSRFQDHETGPTHPERPERVKAVVSHLATLPWRRNLIAFAPLKVDLKWVESVHNLEYIRRAADACKQGLPHLDSMDVAISAQSYDVALLAVGAPLALANAVMENKIQNGFALVRPPGHHAERDSALGFCLFNNIAITAKYLQAVYAVEKIAIVDWDVHHGNGTQHTFEDDPSVQYVSLHQYPFYPGTGAASERGVGRGKGTTVNCPMAAGATDLEYQRAFADRVLPALDGFAPQVILISAGFDAHAEDPLADISLSTESFRWMTERIIEVANKHARGRIISILEGGYNQTRLAQCVSTHLDALRMAATLAGE